MVMMMKMANIIIIQILQYHDNSFVFCLFVILAAKAAVYDTRLVMNYVYDDFQRWWRQ